jgi:integrase
VVRDCARATRDDRESVVRLAYAELELMGYHLKTPQSLKEKHVEALAKRWDERGLSLRTLHKRMSILRVWAGWLGKGDLVKDLSYYYPDRELRRPIAAKENRAWEAKGVVPEEVVEKARTLDERLALYLVLQRAFGLRAKEAIEMRPLRALSEDGTYLEVSDGTKGGRPRIVQIDTEARREAIRMARLVASRNQSRRLRWPDCTWRQAQGRYYRYMRKLGVTKADLGVTSHGLRHGYAQTEYRAKTGCPTPIEGGAKGRIHPEAHRAATLKVAMSLGHGRVDVGGFYYGSYGHGLRTNVVPKLVTGMTYGV